VFIFSSHTSVCGVLCVCETCVVMRELDHLILELEALEHKPFLVFYKS
jgi:hypothetical protein